MQIKTEEISLEELNENIVEYVLTSPYNTNPAILRQMLYSRGVSAPAQTKPVLVFQISGDTENNITNDYFLANIITGDVVLPEDLARITISGTGFVAYETTSSNGIKIDDKYYSLTQILGFSISGGSFGIASLSENGYGLNRITITDNEYKQAYLDALMQEIS